MLYDINTKQKYDERIKEMLNSGYIFPNNAEADSFEKAKSYHHGNSKLLLRTFHNDITRKNEMQYTTMSIYLSFTVIHTRKSFNEEYVK